MNQRILGWLLILIGICLSCVFVAGLFYLKLCPNLGTIETVIPENADVEILLERSTCFGTCPSYSLYIDKTGHIFYNGSDYTQHPGAYEAQMSQEKFQQLVQSFETYNFYRLVAEFHRSNNPLCSDNPFNIISDMPDVTIALSVNGRLTKVDHGVLQPPPALTELENLVDELVGSDRWVE